MVQKERPETCQKDDYVNKCAQQFGNIESSRQPTKSNIEKIEKKNKTYGPVSILWSGLPLKWSEFSAISTHSSLR